MIDLLSSVREPDHWVRLNVGFRSDLQWWDIFLHEWNGVSLFGGVVHVVPKHTITSNASGRWGVGLLQSVVIGSSIDGQPSGTSLSTAHRCISSGVRAWMAGLYGLLLLWQCGGRRDYPRGHRGTQQLCTKCGVCFSSLHGTRLC